MSQVAIAYAEEIEDGMEHYYFRSFLPSKIGGKPAWLNPRNLPKAKELRCAQCRKQLKFLLQIYAPIYEFDRSYHRIVYIFICGEHKCCGKQGTLKVFRSQLPAKNIFYEYLGDDSNEQVMSEDALADKLSKFKLLGLEPYEKIPNCVVCGHLGVFQCGSCKNPLIKYCSKEHQKYHWNRQHRKYCKEVKQMETEKQIFECLKAFPFETFEIVPDEEPLPICVDSEKWQKRYEQSKKNGDADAYNDDDLKLLEEQMAKDFDSVYLKFQERIHRAPQQIIRYADGGQMNEENEQENEQKENEGNAWPGPLWMGKQGMIDCTKDVPKCPQCGGERQFEFQVMPQLLHTLGQGVNDLDWGILAVFSCINSCGDGSKQYFEEFIHYQPSYGAFENRDADGLIG